MRFSKMKNLKKRFFHLHVCAALTYLKCYCIALGNDNIAALTANHRQVLRVELTKTTGGDTRWAEYDNFKVGDESTNYTLFCLGAYSGTAR